MRTGLLVAAVLLAAGCGTTVPASQPGGPAGDGLAGPAGPRQGGALTPTEGEVPQTGAVSSGSSSGHGAGVQGPTAPTAGGPGVSGTKPAAAGAPIEIGLMYSTDTAAALTAIGATPGAASDLRDVQRAVVNYINKHGGVAGHRLVPVFHNVSATDSSSQISQKACAAWTQDARVFAAIPAASVQDNALMRECLGRAGVPAIYPNFYSTTRVTDFAAAPLWFELSSLSLEQFATQYVEGLARQGFFKGARVGLVYDDGPAFVDVVNRVMKPALKRVGATLAAEATTHIHDANDLGSGQSQMSAAVLKFRSSTVSHVMFFEQWTDYFLFLQNAQSQGWNPVYGLSTQNAPQILLDLGLLPEEQLVGAYLASWNPHVDVAAPAPKPWARRQLCTKIYRDAGVHYEGAQATHGALALCGALLDLAEGGRLAPSPLTARGLGLGLERLGPRTQSPVLVRARFDVGRHFGAAQVRPGRFSVPCGCFQYTGPGKDL